MKHHLGIIAIAAVCALGLCVCQKASAAAIVDYARFESPSELATLISKNTVPYILVDVRTAEEYKAGHIPTAVNIPYDTIAQNVPTPDKSALIIVYCKAGTRATAAKKTLDGLGYLHVINFGGISKWTGALNDTSLPGDCPCKVSQ